MTLIFISPPSFNMLYCPQYLIELDRPHTLTVFNVTYSGILAIDKILDEAKNREMLAFSWMSPLLKWGEVKHATT
jgi:hypothetical protein